MKAFTYLSFLLLIAGSAFGLVHYIKADKNGTLSRLYREDIDPAATPQKNENPVLQAPVNWQGKPVLALLTSNSKKPISVKQKKTPPPPPPPSSTKISLRSFSRGAIEEAAPAKILDIPQPAETPVTEAVPAATPVTEAPAAEAPQPVPAVTTEIKEEEKKEVKKEKIPLRKMFSRARPVRVVEKTVIKTEVKEE
jgi:hypothetical protein